MHVADSSRTSLVRARILAVLSLLASLLLALAIIGFLVRNGVYVALGAAGFVLGVAGGWWAISKRPPRRWFGLVMALLGAGLLVAALLRRGTRTGSHSSEPSSASALLVTAVLAGRAALAASLRTTAASRVHRAGRPSYPVLLCNPWSGGGKVERFGLVELATSLGVQTVMLDHGLDLAELARDAIARGADCLGMAGGDGSQALVASIAVEHDLPFVCVAAGRGTTSPSTSGWIASTPPKRLRLPRCPRAPSRLRHGERPILRQQRLPRCLRHHRPTGRLSRGEGGHDEAIAPRDAGRDHRALRSVLRDA